MGVCTCSVYTVLKEGFTRGCPRRLLNSINEPPLQYDNVNYLLLNAWISPLFYCNVYKLAV